MLGIGATLGKPFDQRDLQTAILKVLHRLTDGKAPPASPIDAPQALGLKREPLANVERYDALRDRGLPHAS